MTTITDDFTFNVAKGKVAAYMDGSIGGGSVVAYVVGDTGTEVTDALRDADTLAAAFTVAPQVTALPETTLTNLTVTVDDDADEVRVDADDWSYVNAEANHTTGAIILAWKPSGGTAADTVPVLAFVYEEVTTGSTLNILVPSDGFYSTEDAPS